MQVCLHIKGALLLGQADNLFVSLLNTTKKNQNNCQHNSATKRPNILMPQYLCNTPKKTANQIPFTSIPKRSPLQYFELNLCGVFPPFFAKLTETNIASSPTPAENQIYLPNMSAQGSSSYGLCHKCQMPTNNYGFTYRVVWENCMKCGGNLDTRGAGTIEVMCTYGGPAHRLGDARCPNCHDKQPRWINCELCKGVGGYDEEKRFRCHRPAGQ